MSGPRSELEWARYFELVEDTERAVEAYRRHLARFPGDQEALLRFATNLLYSGGHCEAREAFEALRELDPANAFAVFGLASAHARSGDPTQARRVMEEGSHDARADLELTDLAIVWRETALADVAEAEGRLEDVEAHHARVLEHSEESVRPTTLSNLATFLRERGELERAMRLHLRALELDPDRVFSLVSLAWTLIRMNDTAEASRVLARVETLAPGHTDLLELRLRLGRLTRDWPAVVAAAEELRSRDPLDAQLLGILALAYYRLGRWDQAAQAADKFLFFEPDSLWAAQISFKSHLRRLRLRAAARAWWNWVSYPTKALPGISGREMGAQGDQQQTEVARRGMATSAVAGSGVIAESRADDGDGEGA